MHLKKGGALGSCQALCRAYLSYLFIWCYIWALFQSFACLVWLSWPRWGWIPVYNSPWGLNGWFPVPEAVPSCAGNIWKDKEVQHKAVIKFQLSELMWASCLKPEQGEAGLGCLGCFFRLLVVLAACDFSAVLTASSDSSWSLSLVALNWGLHFPLGRVFG